MSCVPSPASRMAAFICVILALTATVVAFGAITAPSASAAPGDPGWLYGYVHGGWQGVPLPGTEVRVYDTDSQLVASSIVEANAYFSVFDLPYGDYYVYIDPSAYNLANNAGYAGEWYNRAPDLADAQLVHVGASPPDLDVLLSGTCAISGTVTLPGGGGAEDVVVDVFDRDTGLVLETAVTDESGDYSITDLPVAVVSLRFDPQGPNELGGGYLTEYLGHVDGLPWAQTEILMPAVNDFDFELVEGAFIEGEVSGPYGVLEGVHADFGGVVATSAADGSYRVGPVRPGAAHLYANTDSLNLSGPPLFTDWLSPNPISLISGQVYQQDIEIAEVTGIAGRITDEHAIPVAGAQVHVFYAGGDPDRLTTVITDEDGRYAVRLASWIYRVAVEAPAGAGLSSEWFDRANGFDSADLVATWDSAQRADVALEEGTAGLCSIEAQVYSDLPGSADILVEVYDDDDELAASAYTDEDGAARIGGLPFGTYYVRFDPTLHNAKTGQRLMTLWADGTTSREEATPFSMDIESPMASASSYLPNEPGVHGVVTSPEGDPVQGVEVELYDAGDESVATTLTNEWGAYRFEEVTQGEQYKVMFDTTGFNSLSGRNLLSESNDRHRTLASTWRFSYSLGTVLDFQLREAGWIDGTVTAVGGGALEGVHVELWDPSMEVPFAKATTDETGYYSIGNVGDGMCLLNFDAAELNQSGPPFLFSEWYADASGWWSSTPLYPAEGETATYDAELAVGSAFRGVVRGPEGEPLEGVSVLANPGELGEGTPYFDPTAVTDADGEYVIAPLPASEYRMQFTPGADSGYLGEWYEDRENLDSADPIPLDAGTLRSIDATLAMGASLEGTVTGTGGAGMAVVDVAVYSFADPGEWQLARTATTDDDGHWSTGGLTDGEYAVLFDASGFNENNGTLYESEWFDGAAQLQDATLVALGPAEQRDGIDADLTDYAASVGGIVTDGEGAPVPEVSVVALRDVGGGMWSAEQVASTMLDGTWEMPIIHSGDYRFEFAPPLPLANQYYSGAMTQDDATTVSLAPGDERNDINASLLPAGSVTGRVTDRVTHEGVPNQGVLFYRQNGEGSWEQAFSAQTDEDGNYGLFIQSQSTFRVRVIPVDPPSIYPVQWYDDAFSVETATSVTLIPGEEQTLDIGIWPGASISGTVSSGGDPISTVEVKALRLEDEGWVEAMGTVYTDANGEYELTGLPRGTYKVRFRPMNPGYYDGYHPASRTLDGATELVLDNGESRTGVDGQLQRAGVVRAYIAEDTGVSMVPLPYVRGYLFKQAESGWEQVDAVESYEGSLWFGGLEAGTYSFAADGLRSSPWWEPWALTEYGPEFYDNKPTDAWEFAQGSSFGEQTVPAWINTFEVVEGEEVDLGVIGLRSQAEPDADPPVTSVTVPSGWVRGDVKPLLRVEEPGNSPFFTLYGVGADAPSDLRGAPATITAEGVTTLSFLSVDGAGNRETTQTATVRIDKTAPKTLTDAVAAYSAVAFVRLYPTENLSGIEDTRYILDGGAETIGTAALTDETGNHTLTYWSTDKAGNAEAPKTITFRVGGELNAPVTTAIVPSGWQQPPTTFDLLAVDDTDPAPVTYYSLDGGFPSTLYGGPVEVADDGVWVIKFRSVDSNENAEAVKFSAIWVDGTPPTTSATAMASAQEATVTLSATDAHSGVSATWYRIDGGAATKGKAAVISQAGTHTVEYWSFDKAGNEEAPHEVEVFVPYDDSLQLEASAASVTYPTGVTLVGRLRDDFGHTVGGEKVVADWSADGIAWSQVATATAGTSVGTYTVAQRPKATGYYRVRSIGSAAHHAAVSGSARVAVTATLKTPTTPLSVNRNRMFTTTSYVGPTHPTGKSAIVFKFYRYQSGKWVRRKTVNATAGAYRSTSTRLTARTSLPYAGRWRVCAYHAKDAEHPTAVTSSYRTFTVK